MVNQCGTCGKFKKWDDLKGHYTPDTHFTHEEIWYECKDCYNSQLKKENSPPEVGDGDNQGT